ncbi:hypothetical protein ACJJTC_002828 [Scirpophaga incertulas]
MSEIIVLFEGHSKISASNEMIANCSCSLIRGQHNIIVDTMTAWDAKRILKALADRNIAPHMIDYVISTHGHSDHIGNNNLFLKAKHIVGYSISFGEKYFIHNFSKGHRYIINETVQVMPTPGHTLSDVTVLVEMKNKKITAITGDLFETQDDINDPKIWVEAGSEDPNMQKQNRVAVAELAEWIIPGHGTKFRVTDKMRTTLREQVIHNIHTQLVYADMRVRG